jgi:rhodanese-related sulfurtransferase
MSKKISIITLALAISVVSFTAWGKNDSPCLDKSRTFESGKDMTNCMAKDVNNIDPSKVNFKDYDVIIDVRTKEEFDKGSIQGAKNLETGVVPFYIGKLTEDKNAKILVYCKVGGRGIMSAYFLNRLGYKNVTNLTGGYVNYMQVKKTTK